MKDLALIGRLNLNDLPRTQSGLDRGGRCSIDHSLLDRCIVGAQLREEEFIVQVK